MDYLTKSYFPFCEDHLFSGHLCTWVKEVRDIGELISAEYYGEIVHSLSEGYELIDEASFQNFYDTLSQTVQLLYSHHQSPGKDEDQILEETYKYFKEFSADRLKPQYFHLVRLSSPENRDLKKLKKSGELDLLKIMRTQNWQTFIQGKEQELADEIRAYRNTQLNDIEIHYLCRGWVKAGYDLTQISADSWEINVQDSVLILRNIAPYILAADINPWFIPPQGPFTEGVPGYELLRARVGNREVDRISFNDETGRSKVIPYDLINRTKKSARIELIREAIERNLFGTAKSSAEESLYQLLQMMDPNKEQGINRIEIIHTEDFTQKLADLEAFKTLNFERLDAFQAYIHLE